MERAGCVCKGILVASVFAPVKRMVRAISDFRADKTSPLRAAAVTESSKPAKWDWASVDHRWHLSQI